MDLKALSDRLRIKRPASNLDYEDSVRLGDLLANASSDVQQTADRAKMNYAGKIGGN